MEPILQQAPENVCWFPMQVLCDQPLTGTVNGLLARDSFNCALFPGRLLLLGPAEQLLPLVS